MGFEEPTSDPYNIVSKVKEHYCKIKVDQKSKKHGIYLFISQDVLMKERMLLYFLDKRSRSFMRLIFQTRLQWKPFSMVSVQMCPLNSLNSIGICSLAQKLS